MLLVLISKFCVETILKFASGNFSQLFSGLSPSMTLKLILIILIIFSQYFSQQIWCNALERENVSRNGCSSPPESPRSPWFFLLFFFSVKILIADSNLAANLYKKHIVPLVSMYIDFYVRVFVRVFTSPATVKEAPGMKNHIVQTLKKKKI